MSCLQRVSAFFALLAFSTSALADLRLEPDAVSIEVWGRTAEVEFWCESTREPMHYLGTEFCEEYRVYPTRYVSLVGTKDREAKRVRLSLEEKSWEFSYKGSQGESTWFDIIPLLSDGFLTFGYEILGAKRDGHRQLLEVGELSVLVNYDIREEWWTEEFHVYDDRGRPCRWLSPRELCEMYFEDRHYPF
jgi:hypothetical protein